MGRGGTVLARAVRVSGDLRAGVLLARVIHWQPYARVLWDEGLAFIAKTREVWCDETGLTPHQYKRAVTILKGLGLVEVEYHLFGGRRVSHIRLSGDATSIVPHDGPRGTTKVPKPTTGVGAHTTVPVGAGAPVHIRKKDLTMNQEDSLHAIGTKKSMDAAAAAESKIVPLSSLLKRKASVGNARRVWELSWRKTYPGKLVDGWQRTHEKQVRLKVLPLEDSLTLVHKAVTNWPSFIAKVVADTGDKAPAYPQSWFLARHAATLREWSPESAPKVVAGSYIELD